MRSTRRKEWTEFRFNPGVAGLTGRLINSLTFNAEMYLTGRNANPPTPNAQSPATWDRIDESRVQIFNYSTLQWEDMGEQFLTPTAAAWSGTTEATVWDMDGDVNPSNPLVRSKTSGFPMTI